MPEPQSNEICVDSCWDGSCGWPGRRSSSKLPAGARLAPEPLDAFSDVTIREPLRQGVDGELFRAEWRGSRVAVKVGLHASSCFHHLMRLPGSLPIAWTASLG